MRHTTSHKRTIIGPSFQLLSNWCSMGCAGCGIHVSPPPGHNIVTLTEKELANAKTNLRLIKDALEDMGFEYGMVEQSGGEPTHHPQIVEAVGDVFENSVHKIITNGLPTKSVFEYLKRRGEQAFIVFSIDHHKIEYNRIRYSADKLQSNRIMQVHGTILRNLDLFVNNNIPVVISSIISKWNISEYISFIEWLENKYPEQIQNGILVPTPVSLVSFGNPNVGKLNPSADQVSAFEDAIHVSRLLTITRTREWLFNQLIGHYRNKERFFVNGETLEKISMHPSRYPCEIFRYMISFNFQDEEILRDPKEALFQGYLCGVKVLGNLGYSLKAQKYHSLENFKNRPSNMQPDKKYYRTNQIREYINKRESAVGDKELVQMGAEMGYFSDLRKGMCMLDDFDGVWWPFNAFIQGLVDDATLGEYWSLFRNKHFLKILNHANNRAGR